MVHKIAGDGEGGGLGLVGGQPQYEIFPLLSSAGRRQLLQLPPHYSSPL